jgi:hypothetical protein
MILITDTVVIVESRREICRRKKFGFVCFIVVDSIVVAAALSLLIHCGLMRRCLYDSMQRMSSITISINSMHMNGELMFSFNSISCAYSSVAFVVAFIVALVVFKMISMCVKSEGRMFVLV